MVSMNSSGQNGEGSAGIVVVSTGNGGSNIADSGSTRSGITSLVECNNNNTNSNNNHNNNNVNRNCSAMDTNSWKGFQDTSKMNKLKEIVENSTSVSSKCMVDSILQQINQLTEVEKCHLYFKLPTGRSPEQDPLKQPLNPLGSRSEIQLTITWMKTHLGIDSEVSLPKEEVYNEYKLYCANNDFKPLSTADFGKVMKQVFPSVRARRLGQRGMSKYCHSGLRKNYVLDVPTLPTDLSDTSSSSGNSSCNKSLFGLDSTADEDQKASLNIVMEFLEKHFKAKFETIKDLAIFLVENNCVDTRSASAYTLSLDHSTGANSVGKHRETQFQLQKKLHEREQKRKLQEQQPGMPRSCIERSKARRRSGASRNSSGGSNSSSSSEIRSLSSGSTVAGASKSSLTDNHESKNVVRGSGKPDSSSVADICLKKENIKELKSLTLDPIITPASLSTNYPIIKQEDNPPSTRLALPSIIIGAKDKVNSVENTISQVGKSPQKFIRGNSCGEDVTTISNSSSFVATTKGTSNSNSAYFMLSNPNTNTSSKNRYKPIQPKVGQCENNNINSSSNNSNGNNNINNIINNNNISNNNNNNNNNNNISLNSKVNSKSGITQSSESFHLYDSYSSREIFANQQNAASANPNFNSLCMDQPQSNFHQTNNHQPHADQDDLMPSYSSYEVDDLQKSTQISELRKLLQKNLPAGGSSPCIGLAPVGIGLSDEYQTGMMDDPDAISSAAIRRKVSFQTSLDGNGNAITSPILSGNINPTSQNPVSCTKAFNFTPIPNPSCGTSQGVSQASSANASPFISPRNTPLPRSRHNSGQTSSAYVTPRSTPYTPDMSMQTETLSENSTPFMSPAPTPIPRSRHNSSQNMRSHYPPPCRIRHSSGASGYRRTPYADDFSGRRNGNKHRHYSGSIPPSPQSAPLSPLVHDSSSHSLSEILHFNHQPMVSSASMQGAPTNVGNNNDLRRRHMSAGPTIHYQPQPHMQSVTYSNNTISSFLSNSDLSQEISSLNNLPAIGSTSNTTGSSGNSNRPQSVPLPQMLNTADLDYLAKSHPNTPLINQQFHFNPDCNLSHHSSYAPTPVPSEYNDFVDYSSNLEFDSVEPVLTADGTNTNADLESISASFSGLSHPDFSSAIPDSFSNVSGTGIAGINESSFVESVEDGAGTQYSQCDEGGTHAVSHVIACSVAPASNVTEKTIINQGRDSVLCTKNGNQPQQQQQRQNDHPIVTQPLMLNGNSQLTLNALNAHPLGLNVSDSNFEPPSAQLEVDFTPTLMEFPDQVFNSLVLDVNKD